MKRGAKILLLTWVLWQKLVGPGSIPDRWAYVYDYDDTGQCDAAIVRLLDYQSESPNVVQKVLQRYFDNMRFINQDGYEMSLFYVCAPDTIDPRPRS
jgi:hypothetical protein